MVLTMAGSALALGLASPLRDVRGPWELEGVKEKQPHVKSAQQQYE